MKKVFLFMLTGAVLASCGSKGPKTSDEAGDAATTSGAAAVYTVVGSQSTLSWRGWKANGDDHTGTIVVKNGELKAENNEIKAGSFVIDMNSINPLTPAEMTAESKAKLTGHLKSKDFFQTDSFPEAKFEITKVEKLENAAEATHKIYGNLTVKGISREISFPATIHVTDANTTASAKFEINRNEWGIVWGGEKDANIMDQMKDNMLGNMFAFDVKLVANK